MKVLFKSYNTCCQNANGGVQIRLRKIRDLLNINGVKTDLFNEFETNIEEYDIIHFFKLEPENYALIKCAKERGVKIVISSIINLSGGKSVNTFRKFRKLVPITTSMKLAIESLELADCIIAETKMEAEMIAKDYGISKNKIKIIPNGIDEIDSYGDEIYDTIGEKKRYCLQVGRFNKNKNQLNVIKAVKGTDITAIFVGGEDFRNKQYYSECLKEAEGSKNIIFLGWLEKDSALLKSAYGNADIVVIPSFEETFGLVVLEGGIAGAKLALSSTLPILGFDTFKSCSSFDPHSATEIRCVLENLYHEKKDYSLQKSIIENFSWKKIIEEHISLYEGLLNEKSY